MPGLSCNRTRVRLPRLTGLEDYFRVARQPESGLPNPRRGADACCRQLATVVSSAPLPPRYRYYW
jgi:hypothetical protein